MLLLYFLFVLILKLQFHSTDYISTFTNGSLALNSTITFSMFTEDFSGVIFDGVDSFRNGVKMKVIVDNNGSRMIRIKYNDAYTDNFLRDICGCDKCNYQYVNMTIRLNNEKINVTCNNYSQSEAISGQNTNKNKTSALAIPMKVKDTNNLIYLMVGNIRPFIGIRGRNTFPNINQLIACVFYFKINKTGVQFDGPKKDESQVGDKVQHQCIKQCVTKDICNEGQCLETYTHLVCVCNNTALNGPRCNNSLKTYIEGVNTSYTIKKVENHAYMKMTWRSLNNNSREHCLLEFVNNDEYELIFVDEIISDTFRNVTTNFVNINITKSYIDYKMMNKNKSLKFHISEYSRINIGFSERTGVCATFIGEYDFYYDASMLQLYDFRAYSTSTYTDGATNVSESTTNTTTDISTPDGPIKCLVQTKSMSTIIVSLVAVVSIINIGITTVCTVMRRRSTRLLHRKLQAMFELMEFDEHGDSDTVNRDYKDYSIVNNVDYYTWRYRKRKNDKLIAADMKDFELQLLSRNKENLKAPIELIEVDKQLPELSIKNLRIVNNVAYSNLPFGPLRSPWIQQLIENDADMQSDRNTERDNKDEYALQSVSQC